MNTVIFKKLLPNAQAPEYKTSGSAGADLAACLSENEIVLLHPGEIKLIRTGLLIQLPEGFEGQIRPRSGLSLKGITIVNAPGTIDNDYRGEISIVLQNLGKDTFTIEPKMRIAQLVIAPYFQAHFIESEVITETIRGEKGFGSTGI